MPVELRKRKAAPPPPPPPAKKPARSTKKAAATENKPALAKEKASTNGSGGDAKPAVGDTITLDGFGGEIETNDGVKTTLKALVDESKGGVAIFTYPKASTPGCTRQACLFRDAYTSLTSPSGLAVYGLSSDSPKANTTFKTKQNLPYPLLCDPSATLIAAIGLKKAPKGTTRGVFVVSKEGKVLAAQAGGPEVTLRVVEEVVEGLKGGEGEEKEVVKEEREGEKKEREEGEGKDEAVAEEKGPEVNGEKKEE